MNIIESFIWISDHLIWFMGAGLCVALVLRFVAFRVGKRNHQYFTTFSASVEKQLEGEDPGSKIENVDHWLTQFLYRITGRLPDRSVRFTNEADSAPDSEPEVEINSGPRKESMTEFAGGKKALLLSMKQQSDAFKSPHPPNFNELTNRVLKHDNQWRTILGFMPVDTLSRILSILPGLFIVSGIFGTFLGITGALPLIAKIDLNNINEAVPILNKFVSSIAFAMHTSIAGIICSVVMTVLNALFPITAVRDEVRKSLTRAFESIWYRIHGDKVSSADQRVIELLSKIHDSLERDAGSSKQAS